MSPDEFTTALERLGFSNRGFCRWLGCDERTGRKWAAGVQPIPRGLVAFLRLALALKLNAHKLRKLLGEG